MPRRCPECDSFVGNHEMACPNCGTANSRYREPTTAASAYRQQAPGRAPFIGQAPPLEPDRETTPLPRSRYREGYKAPDGLARVLQLAFGIWVVLGGAIVATDVRLYAAVSDVISATILSGLDAGESLNRAIDRQNLVGLLQLAGYGAVGILFIVWLRRLYRNAFALGARSLRHSSAWVAGSWFVPVLNLWRPKQIVNDVWRASAPNDPPLLGGSWQRRGIPRGVNAWWVLWLVGGLFGLSELREANSFAQLQRQSSAWILSDLIEVAAAVAALWLVTNMTRRQNLRASNLGLRPQPESKRADFGRLYVLLPALAVGVFAFSLYAWDDDPGQGTGLANEQTGQPLTQAGVSALVAEGQARVDEATLDRLRDQCRSGDLVGCDVLGIVAPPNSPLQSTALSCGDRNPPLSMEYCVGHHNALDVGKLRRDCGAGDFGSCDLLWVHVPFGHEDEAFAEECGGVGRPELTGLCLLTFGVGNR